MTTCVASDNAVGGEGANGLRLMRMSQRWSAKPYYKNNCSGSRHWIHAMLRQPSCAIHRIASGIVCLSTKQHQFHSAGNAHVANNSSTLMPSNPIAVNAATSACTLPPFADCFPHTYDIDETDHVITRSDAQVQLLPKPKRSRSHEKRSSDQSTSLGRRIPKFGTKTK